MTRTVPLAPRVQATAHELAKTLKKAGSAEVSVLTLARTEGDDDGLR